MCWTRDEQRVGASTDHRFYDLSTRSAEIYCGDRRRAVDLRSGAVENRHGAGAADPAERERWRIGVGDCEDPHMNPGILLRAQSLVTTITRAEGFPGLWPTASNHDG